MLRLLLNFLAAVLVGAGSSVFANSAPVASGSAALRAVPKGVQSYVLQGEQVGNLFLNTFSDPADASRTNGLFVIHNTRRNAPPYFAALKSDGSVFTWGQYDPGGGIDSNGIDGSSDSTPVPDQLSGGVLRWFKIGTVFAALKSDGSVVTWGGKEYDRELSRMVADQLSGRVLDVFSTGGAFAALRSDGSVVTWGAADYGGNSSIATFIRRPDGNYTGQVIYTSVASQLSSGVTKIFYTGGAFAALKSDGSVITWGRNDNGGDSSRVADKLAGGVVEILSTQSAFAALKSDGSVVTWGDRDHGGDPVIRSDVPFTATPTYRSVVDQLSSDVVEIFSNGYAFAALKSDGSVVTWGWPTSGGDSSLDYKGGNFYHTAVASKLTSGVVEIFSNGYAFAALKSDGSVVTWGGAAYGGNSSVQNYFSSSDTYSYTSVANKLSSGVARVSPSWHAFAALKSDGSVVTWGGAKWGEGNSSVATSSDDLNWTYTSVANRLTGGVVEIFSHGHAFAALKSDGSVVTWGYAAYGGNGSSVSSQLSSGVVTLATTRQESRLVRGNALAGVAVVGNSATAAQGSWQYSSNGFNWSNVPTSLSDSSALILANTTQLRFAPASTFAGTPGGLTVRLIETGGTSPLVTGTTQNVSVNGGSSQISAQKVALDTRVYASGSSPVLDGTPPTLRITVPGGTSVRTRAQRFTLQGTASDNVSPALVQFRIKPPGGRYGNWANMNLAAGSATTKAWSRTVALSRRGTWAVQILAFDSAGNASATRTVFINRL